jgi:hypothetical protein
VGGLIVNSSFLQNEFLLVAASTWIMHTLPCPSMKSYDSTILNWLRWNARRFWLISWLPLKRCIMSFVKRGWEVGSLICTIVDGFTGKIIHVRYLFFSNVFLFIVISLWH